jgi:hypothetical protein
MKKIILTSCFLAMTAFAFAQEKVTSATDQVQQKVRYSRDFLMIQLGYDGWASAPDSVTTGFNRGINVAFMYDFPIKDSKFSLSAGLGFSSSNVKLKNHLLDMQTTTNSQSYKVSTNYVEVPLEIRYRQHEDNANKGWKAALGLKGGMLLNAHTKAKNTLGGEKNIIKEQNKRLFNTWRFAATARVGYGNVGLFATMNLTPLFKENSGSDIRPYSMGIVLSGL